MGPLARGGSLDAVTYDRDLGDEPEETGDEERNEEWKGREQGPPPGPARVT